MGDLRLTHYPIAFNYLNPNVWITRTVNLMFDSRAGLLSKDEEAFFNPEIDYYAYATVRNYGSPDSSASVHFFRAPSAPQPHLKDAQGIGSGNISVPGTGRPQVVHYNVAKGETFQFPTGPHFCLIAILLETGIDNKYLKPDGTKKDGDLPVMIPDPKVAQHNLDIAVQRRFPGSSITHYTHINVYGSSDVSSTSLVFRQASRSELGAIRDLLGPRAERVRDVTERTRVAFLDSEPSDQNPVEDDKLGSLPRRIQVEKLEEDCTRMVYLGIQLPEEAEKEETDAAFLVVEQAGEDGKMVGAVAVVALSRDLVHRGYERAEE